MDNDKTEDKEIKNDEVLEKDYLSSLIEQEERLVYYEIENIYRDSKKKECIKINFL